MLPGAAERLSAESIVELRDTFFLFQELQDQAWGQCYDLLVAETFNDFNVKPQICEFSCDDDGSDADQLTIAFQFLDCRLTSYGWPWCTWWVRSNLFIFTLVDHLSKVMCGVECAEFWFLPISLILCDPIFFLYIFFGLLKTQVNGNDNGLPFSFPFHFFLYFILFFSESE